MLFKGKASEEEEEEEALVLFSLLARAALAFFKAPDRERADTSPTETNLKRGAEDEEEEKGACGGAVCGKRKESV